MNAGLAQAGTEREQLIALLENSEKRWLAVLSSVPECACGVKISDECWSILQVAEHVAAAEHGMFWAMELAKEKTTPPNYEVDKRLIGGATNREVKRQAPAPSLPKGRWMSIGECAEAFKKSRARTIEYVRTADNLRGRFVIHPLLGELDGHQMVLVMAGHPERHALQILEITGTAAYNNAVLLKGSS